MRFSLKAMLALVTVFGLLLGYSQWRRQMILSLSRFLDERGLSVPVPSSWLDQVWQRTPRRAVVRHPAYSQTSLDAQTVGLMTFVVDDEMKDALNELGIAEVRCAPEIWDVMELPPENAMLTRPAKNTP